jgi:protein-disulfide isomerase
MIFDFLDRRLRVTIFRRSLLSLVLICLGCSAQSTAPDISRRIEQQVRSYYSVPQRVKITVGPLHPSADFPSYSALTVTMEGDGRKQDFEFLLSKDSKTLLRMTRLDLSKDPYAEVMKKMDLTGRPTRGNKNAKVVAVNYDDFQCPYCSRMHQTLFPEIFKEYGDKVLFIYKDYPLAEIHPWAVHAAVNANCLATQNSDAYWDLADYLHANQAAINGEKGAAAQFAALDRITTQQGQKHNLDLTKLQACLKAQDEGPVRASMKEGDALGVNATPTLFVNGQQLDGAVPIDEIRAALDRALQDAGIAPPQHAGETPAAPEHASH